MDATKTSSSSRLVEPADRSEDGRAAAFAAAVGRVFAEPTARQSEMIDAILGSYFGRSDLRAAPSGGDDLAVDTIRSAYETQEQRRLLVQVLIVIEMYRGTGGGEAQALALEALADELGVDEDYLVVGRDAALGTFDLLAADWMRLHVRKGPDTSNAAIRESDPEALRRLCALERCPEGSVGRALLDFYLRHGHPVPGDPRFGSFALVAHDVHHVLAEYGTTREEEVALQAFLVAASRGELHFGGFLASIARHELNAMQGMFTAPSNELSPGVRPVALAEALAAGENVEPGFASLEVLDVLDEPIDEVRRKYGVPKRLVAPSYRPSLIAVQSSQDQVGEAAGEMAA